MKILIVGGVAGGASAAARLRRLGEQDQIIVFEKGPHVSFSNCSLPYHLSGIVPEAEDLVLMDPDIFYKQYRLDMRTRQEVIAILPAEKKVQIKKLDTGEVYFEAYDKLILSPGASPVVPPIPGLVDMPHFTLRNVVDVDGIHRFIQAEGHKKVAVIGGGFIGVEVAENLVEGGYPVSLIEGTDQILRPFDEDMVQIFHKELWDRGVDLHLGDMVHHFAPGKVVLASEKEIEADCVILAIGVRPETGLAKEAGLQIGKTGAIAVNGQFQTSDPSIYAIGDAIEIDQRLLHQPGRLTLAGPALKQARAVADHIHGIPSSSTGYIGSSAIKVFSYNGAATGLNEGQLKGMNQVPSYEVVRLILSDRVGLMPEASPLHLKLIFEVPTGKILGAQAIGHGDVTKRIDVLASVLQFGGTVYDLKDLELAYAPPFATAKDVVNYAGYIGANLLQGTFRQVQVSQMRSLVDAGAYIVDVREPYEYEKGHIKGAVNIPLSQLRDRMQEIPKDCPVYVHCRTGQRSYNAVMALQNSGFNNVFNVTGSFLALSFYEYFKDLQEKREPIVTAYNFN